MDENKNIWLTVPKTLVINGKQYYPVLGDYYICDGIRYSFTTKEIILQMVAVYFKSFSVSYCGIETEPSLVYISEELNDTIKYPVFYQKFKSQIHNKIEAYISSN